MGQSEYVWQHRDETVRDIFRGGFAELVAHFFFIFGTCAGLGGLFGPGTINVIAGLVFGFAIIATVFSVGHVSGGHINPAVTFGIMVSGRMSFFRGFVYIFFHIVAACLAAGLMRGLVPAARQGCFAANAVSGETALAQAIFAEMVGTFLLTFVVGAALDGERSNQAQVPVSVGMAVGAAHFLLVPLTGCSINPTRTLASAIASTGIAGCEKAWPDYWVFIVGPLIGGALGALTYQTLFHTIGLRIMAGDRSAEVEKPTW